MEIDEDAYNAGRKDFKRGGTLRQLFEATKPPEKMPQDFDHRKGEQQAMSRIFGFGDAFLEWMRGGMRK